MNSHLIDLIVMLVFIRIVTNDTPLINMENRLQIYEIKRKQTKIHLNNV